MNDTQLTGPTTVPWTTPEQLQAMTPLERAQWACKDLNTDDKFQLVDELIRGLRQEALDQ